MLFRSNALLVRRFQRFDKLFRQRQRFLHRHWTTQRFSGDVFHHQELLALAFLQSIDRRDVGMIERREYLRLALEAREPLRITRKGFGQSFDGNFAIQLSVAGEIHLTHPAGAQRRENLVRSDLEPRGKHLDLDYTRKDKRLLTWMDRMDRMRVESSILSILFIHVKNVPSGSATNWIASGNRAR